MVALVVVLAVVVALETVLLAGLLRSHADILRALHSLGAGVGDPAAPEPTGASQSRDHGSGAGPVPVTMGPPLPVERSSTGVFDLAGVTPTGDALAVSVATGAPLTLIAFLSSGCASCAGIWSSIAGGGTGLPPEVRLVVATKGPELESPAAVAAQAAGVAAPVVMSTEAWSDYEVPGSPFFALVDGERGARIGEGVANTFAQVVELVHRARRDLAAGRAGGSEGGGHARGLDGPARESANDRELIDAGVLPGDPSLYPASLDDLYGPAPGGPGPRGER